MLLQKSPPKILQTAATYLQESVAPQAITLDEDSKALGAALQGLGDRSLLALRVPVAEGGTGFSEKEFRLFQEMMTRYSGALAFLQTQHQSAATMLAKSENKSLRQQYLPHLSQGSILLGVGFSQLRRSGKPVITAIPVAEGYQLRGKVPWVTGFNFFSHLIGAATLPDGGAVYGVLPFQDSQQPQGGKITFSDPMPLAAMSATNTVSAQLEDWFLPHSQIVSLQKAGHIHGKDRQNVLNQSFHALGTARAGLDIVEATYKRKQLPFVLETWQSLDQQLQNLRQVIFATLDQPETPFQQKLELRAKSINLGHRCVQAAVTVSSGAANYRYHSAQRVYREMVVFSVSGQTTAVMEATLGQLAKEG